MKKKIGRPRGDRKVRQITLYLRDEEWEQIRKNTQKLKDEYGLPRSIVAKRVFIKRLADRDFLRFLGLVE